MVIIKIRRAGHVESFWDSGNALFLDLGGGYKGIHLIIHSAVCLFGLVPISFFILYY